MYHANRYCIWFCRAEDALNKVLDTNPIVSSRASKACSTLESRLVGFEGICNHILSVFVHLVLSTTFPTGYTPNLEIRLIQDYDISLSVAKRLAKAYGGRAREVLDIAREMSSGDKDLYEKLVIPGHPYLEAEVVFSVRHDWACHAEDFIARRSRLAFLNKGAALAAIPRVVEIMAKELHWDTAQQKEEVRRCIEFMRHMGGTSPIHGAKVSVRMATVADIRDSFRKIDVKHSGVLNKEEVRFLGEMLNYQLSEEEINDCLDYASSLNIPAGKVSFEAVSSWWNSDRKNQGLVHLKQNNMASADQIEGSGTVFG